MAAARQLLHLHSACCCHRSQQQSSIFSRSRSSTGAFSLSKTGPTRLVWRASLRTAPPKALPVTDGTGQAADDDDDGVSLGTMKLPPNTDIARFETLLFQWANSLCQGANLPLPVPLKVDKVEGGARLGFINVDDGKTEVCVYIDCLVFPATDDSGPLFRASRNGPMKDRAPPGEQRIMRSLLQALQKSVQIASI
ncbi:uncharacterized protein LOC103718878 [Phoenix dactylifera]|uniref:Uncharacterized protein LOC103718878 n=1 Tax=Phoenix dactylifera TaxID=42345 RepID=A0A8B7CTB0_PHODC|nr:uncharacterized protein LOC103718878 [Phoenix dactylifera]